MAINTNIHGGIVSWEVLETSTRGREKVRGISQLRSRPTTGTLWMKSGRRNRVYDAIVAPATFVPILGKLVQADLVRYTSIPATHHADRQGATSVRSSTSRSCRATCSARMDAFTQ